MKRIENILKEIERKDKINRALFIGFVLLIAGFMAYVLISEQRIDRLEIINSDTYKKLEKEKSVTLKHLHKLEKSLKPEEYWEVVQKENSVEGYIAYITNDWSIDNEAYIDKAIDKLNSPNVGEEDFHGWLFVGFKDSRGNFTIKEDMLEVIYRKDKQEDLANSEIQAGEIVRLKTTRNRNTYQNKNLSKANTLGWRNKTKAFVTDTRKNRNNDEFYIKIKYY